MTCKQIHHTGITCQRYNEFKITDNKEYRKSEEYKQKYTRKCPNCNVHIEKNQKCNHIKCTKYGYDLYCLQKYYDGHIRESIINHIFQIHNLVPPT